MAGRTSILVVILGPKYGWSKEKSYFIPKTTRQNHWRKIFSRLHLISLCKKNLVGELRKWVNDTWNWTLEWRRDRRTWESDEEQQLLALISQVQWNRKSTYSWCSQTMTKGCIQWT